MFNQGFNEYIAGDWKKAKEWLDKVEVVKGSIDYPSKNILSIMEETHFVAPKDWEGYRVLTEK